jgi:outer membrane protein assembly factor BamB
LPHNRGIAEGERYSLNESRIGRCVPACGLFALACAGASAQSVDWMSPIYAEVPPWSGGGGLQDSSFMPDFDPSSRHQMLLSDAGTPGVVVSGGGQIDEEDLWTPSTPWIAKIAIADGAPLWRWHPDDYSRGSFSEIAVDGAGDVVAVGSQASPAGFLLVKFDGATGAVRWRVDGAVEYVGLGVAFDSHGNVVMTATRENVEQAALKFAGENGAFLWASSIPDAEDWGDGLIALDAAGNAAIGGAYSVGNDGSREDGLQIAKVAGDDGHAFWCRRFAGGFMDTVHTIDTLPNGDVVFAAGYGSGARVFRLDAETGETVWEHADVGTDDVVVDGDGFIVAGGFIVDGNREIADLQRIDPATGGTLWRRQFPEYFYTTVRQLAIGSDGQLLAALSEGDEFIAFEAAGFDLRTGELRWWYAPTWEYHPIERSFPVGIVQNGAGNVLFGGYKNDFPVYSTWAVYSLAPIAADTIFLSGLEGYKPAL